MKARGRLRRILVAGQVMASPAGAAAVGAAIGAMVGVVIELKQDWAVLNSLAPEDFWLHLLGGAIGVGAIGAVAGFIVGWLRQGQDKSQ